jgi:predicted outer membrane repeat protein
MHLSQSATQVILSGIVRVTPAGAGSNDGSSWANALPGATLKSALDGVPAGVEFWVAAGTYKPAAAGGSRSASFVLKNGVALYGGFAGTETARAQRDWAANLTLLSGDLNGNDSGFTNNGENSNHVVTGATGATIDGFTITGGSGNQGAGMYNNSASPSVVNCSISGNYGTSDGGGMYNLTASPTITNCTFSGNRCAIDGGAIYNSSSPATITNCTFSNNTSNDDGGGIYNRTAAATVTNCTFNNNRSNDDGGAIYVDGGAPVVTNCLFTDNSSGYWGGAICTNSSGAPSVTNCTFNGHTASVAGATVRHLGGVSTLTNCIVWGSAAPAQIVDVSGGKLAVTYCCVKGGYAGATNTAGDPLFVNAAAGDFHLQPGSPCLDSGTGTGAPATDKDGNGRYDVRAMTNGGGAPDYVDMGAFEAQGLSSWSINLNTGILALTFSCVADGASLVASGLVIQDAATATKSYRLTNLGAVPLDGTTLSLVLSAQDLNALKATPGLAKDLATAWLRLDADSVHASAGPVMMPSPDGYALQASSFIGDSERPTLTALTSTTPDGAYAAGATINVTVNFSEPVTLAGGALNVTLDTGAVVNIPAFGPAVSASASYTVAAGQNSADLTATAVALGAGATLTDTSGLVIVTPIPLPATNIATGSAVIIDTSAPNAPVLSGSTPTNRTRPVWTWTSSGGGGNGLFRCKLDDADLASGATQTILPAFVTPDALANLGS